MLDASVDSHGKRTSVDTSITGDSVADQFVGEEEGGRTREEQARDERYKRLIDWNVDLLTRLLGQMAQQRKAGNVARNFESWSLLPKPGTSTIEEVKEIIRLGGTTTANGKESTTLEPEAISQLRYFVTSVCAMYRDNPCRSRRGCVTKETSFCSDKPAFTRLPLQSTILSMPVMLL